MVNISKPETEFELSVFTQFCNEYGFIFPESVIAFLKKNNDGELEPNVINGFDEGYYIRYFYGTTNESYSNIADVYEMSKDRLPLKCVPIADPDFGNEICMSLRDDSYGQIFFWDHETMDTEYDEECTLKVDDMILIANSFDKLLEKIVESPYQ